jgi:hypothetical protein
MHTVIKLHLLIFSTLLAFSCGPSDEDYGPDETGEKEPLPISNLTPIPAPSLLNCPKGTLITYENFGSGFISRFCLTCHSSKVQGPLRGGAPVGVNFESSLDIQFYRALILLRTNPATTKPMPPTRELPRQQRLIFNEWLECGAPEANRNATI